MQSAAFLLCLWILEGTKERKNEDKRRREWKKEIERKMGPEEREGRRKNEE